MTERKPSSPASALASLDGVIDVVGDVVRSDHHPLPLFTLTLRLRDTADYDVLPGQFVMALAPNPLEPYLRRAFSVFSISRGEHGTEVQIHGKIIGRGTAALAHCQPGDEVRLLGPLGNGFQPAEAQHHLLVAGGVGSAALLMLGQALVSRGQKVSMIYGGRSAVDLAHSELFAELAERSGGRFVATTEDGSAGVKGRVTGPLRELLAEQSEPSQVTCYTCGPEPMMAAVSRVAQQYRSAVQAALETPMGCGYGACLGCVVPKTDGTLELCCRSGPVFDGAEVAW